MSRRRLLTCGSLLVLGGITCWFFPLFHVRPLGGGGTGAGGESPAPRRSGPADPVAYANGVWNGPRRTGDAGVDVVQLWNALDADSSKARSEYGRQAGLGGAWYFCVRGQGTVESVEKNRVVLGIPSSPRHACLELGVVVGNTVREAVGVKAGDFANSQELNAVSTELNRRVERDVIAPHRSRWKPGVFVDFIGCAKIGGESDLDPLCLIPIRLEIRDDERSDTNPDGDGDAGASP